MAFDGGSFTKSMAKLALEYQKRKFKSIIVVSAHYESNVFAVTCSKKLKTIHDHGFSDYFDFEYNGKGDEELG